MHFCPFYLLYLGCFFLLSICWKYILHFSLSTLSTTAGRRPIRLSLPDFRFHNVASLHLRRRSFAEGIRVCWNQRAIHSRHLEVISLSLPKTLEIPGFQLFSSLFSQVRYPESRLQVRRYTFTSFVSLSSSRLEV